MIFDIVVALFIWYYVIPFLGNFLLGMFAGYTIHDIKQERKKKN